MAMTFRFAEADDAEKFARWAAENPQIDRQDILAATKEKNPTTTYLVIEEDGEPVMFLPAYLVLRIGYLGFNPAATADQREAAMGTMFKALQVFAQEHQIGSIDTLTRSTIPVARWARRHGFTADTRELFTAKVPRKRLQSPPEGTVN